MDQQNAFSQIKSLKNYTELLSNNRVLLEKGISEVRTRVEKLKESLLTMRDRHDEIIESGKAWMNPEMYKELSHLRYLINQELQIDFVKDAYPFDPETETDSFLKSNQEFLEETEKILDQKETLELNDIKEEPVNSPLDFYASPLSPSPLLDLSSSTKIEQETKQEHKNEHYFYNCTNNGKETESSALDLAVALTSSLFSLTNPLLSANNLVFSDVLSVDTNPPEMSGSRSHPNVHNLSLSSPALEVEPLKTERNFFSANTELKNSTPSPSLMLRSREWLRNHSKGALFQCRVCEKAFPSNSRRKRHEKTHTGEKPFACSLCPHRCSAKSALKRHEQTHSKIKPFSCTLCKKVFADNSNLKRHLRTFHGLN